MKIIKYLFIIFIFFNIFSVGFCTDGYVCKILMIRSLSDDGKISPPDFTTASVGDQFTIDRVTGRMIGKLWNSNKNFQPKVLDRGDGGYSFKAVTVFADNSLAYLYVREFQDSLEKPFLFVTDSIDMISGTCKNY